MRKIDFSQYSSSRILVTGASGFIGSMLCDRLSQYGAEVHAVSRRPHTADRQGINWWQGDLADYDGVKRLFSAIQPEIVFHLASEVTGSRELGLVLPTLRGNLVSAVNVFIAATENNCLRVVTAGSLEEPDETDVKAIPCSPYAAAKWASGGYARMFHALYEAPIVVARLFMVYGPGQQDLRKLVPYVILSLLRGESPKLSSGQRPVDWVYVEDVVDGLLAMGIAEDINGATMDLGSGQLVTTRDVVERVSRIIDSGVPLEFGVVPERPMERVRVADAENTYRALGWQPGYSLQRGLEETVLWYRRQHESGK